MILSVLHNSTVEIDGTEYPAVHVYLKPFDDIEDTLCEDKLGF